jgi:hypothetical protein
MGASGYRTSFVLTGQRKNAILVTMFCISFRIRFVCAVFVTAVLLFSCKQPDIKVNPAASIAYPPSVHKVELNRAGYGTVRLEDLEGDDIYLVKINSSRNAYSANIMPTDSFVGGGQTADGTPVPAGTITLPNGETITVLERHWQIETPPPSQNALTANRRMASVYTAATEVDVAKKSFYLDATNKTADATLRYIGNYCKIWVVDESFDDASTSAGDKKVTRAQLQTLATTFDNIYLRETNLLGYEYGGGPGGNGGVDGDSKIQILVYDLNGSGGGLGSILGYFYPGDEYQRSATYAYSNEAEIFYIDSVRFDLQPTVIYSTLIHEFNHMINFHLKVLVGGQIRSWNSETWYTEMLSMLAEDTIGPDIGINAGASGHVIKERIPSWLFSYDNVSVMSWSYSNPLSSYASNYAFGAYLIRNFGGTALLSAIAKSHGAGRGSIDTCLRAFHGPGVDTAYAMERFGEALVYYDDIMEQTYTFNKNETGSIGDYEYTFTGFNIGENGTLGSPEIFDFADLNSASVPANSVRVYTDEENWKNVYGPLDIFFRAADANMKYFVMVKPHE